MHLPSAATSQGRRAFLAQSSHPLSLAYWRAWLPGVWIDTWVGLRSSCVPSNAHCHVVRAPQRAHRFKLRDDDGARLVPRGLHQLRHMALEGSPPLCVQDIFALDIEKEH